jgi:sugar (pentulose or hexulose) kinase
LTADPSSGGDGWLLGIDIGTSSVKALAVGLDGRQLASASVEHPMQRPRPGWAENDPEDWLRGVSGAVKQLVASYRVEADAALGIGIVSQRDPWVLLDDSGRPLAPSISWTDRRTSAEVAQLDERFGRPWLIDRTGVLPIPGLGLPTLMWSQRHQPELWRGVRRLRAPKDFVLERLTGADGTDITMPARSVMNDVRRDDWCEDICSGTSIPLEFLPPVGWRSWEAVAELPPRGAEVLGVRAGIPVAAGGGDDPSATLGSGAIAEGDLCAGTGTSSDWRIVTRECQPDAELARGDLARHVVADEFIFEVCIESTGSSLRWFRDEFADRGGDYLALIEQARPIAPGADGLVFLPFVDGSNRAPWFMEGATGGFLGIVSGHTRAHFVRAILEGIAFQYPPTLELVAPGRDPTQPITLVDGEARSELWNQLKADVLGVPIRTTECSACAALGAAILGGQAAGLFASAREGAEQLVRFNRTYEPDLERHERYIELRSAYEGVLGAVRPTYASASQNGKAPSGATAATPAGDPA